MMAVVQGLTHYVTLCMADTVRRLGVDIEKTLTFTSPVYQIELSLVGRLLSQDPALYADILQQNPFVPGVLAACRDSAAELVHSRFPRSRTLPEVLRTGQPGISAHTVTRGRRSPMPLSSAW